MRHDAIQHDVKQLAFYGANRLVYTGYVWDAVPMNEMDAEETFYSKVKDLMKEIWL